MICYVAGHGDGVRFVAIVRIGEGRGAGGELDLAKPREPDFHQKRDKDTRHSEHKR
jgi:hypothetical protein